MTAGNHQPGARITTLQATDLLARFAIRLRGDRAGIKHHDIGFPGIGSHLMPELHELICPGFQLGLIKPAAERLEIDIHESTVPEKFRGF